jgi:hypothetical protein
VFYAGLVLFDSYHKFIVTGPGTNAGASNDEPVITVEQYQTSIKHY